jgi:magnesium-transporting ATPase (P-type)
MKDKNFSSIKQTKENIASKVKPATLKKLILFIRENKTHFLKLFLFLIGMIFLVKFLLKLKEIYEKEEIVTKRNILLEKKDENEYECKNKFETTNELRTTRLKMVQNEFVVTFLSFFIGFYDYLSDIPQIWSLIIIGLQVYFFKSFKSLYPLILFGFLVAFKYAFSEKTKLQKDNLFNDALVNLNGKFKKKRSQIKPGDMIFLKAGEESPCDFLIINKISKNPKEKILMNEVKVKFFYKKR